MDRKEIAEEIKATEEKLADLRAKLEEKPKLRHGDWWKSESSGCIHVFLKEFNNESRPCVAVSDCLITNIGSDYHGEKIEGNIFSDLKALAEPLEEFNLGCLRVHISPQNGCMYIDDDDGDNLRVPKDDLDEFSMAVRRLILTDKGKRNENKI